MTREEILAAIASAIEDPVKRAALLKQAILNTCNNMADEQLLNVYSIMFPPPVE